MRRAASGWQAGVVAMLLALVQPGAALAQAPKPADKTAPAPAAPQAAPSGLRVPPAEMLLALIRSTMSAINHANLTNNYTVLRDLGSPLFQSTTTPEQLSKAFAAQRARGIDLTLSLAITPELSVQPGIESNGVMRLVGHYPTNPRVEFNFAYQNIAGFWRHAGLQVNVLPPAPPPEAKAPAAEAPRKEPAAEPRKDSGKKKAQ
ncbi:MAG: hypothetical protein NW223_18660 [Hyphomicrobiaceae bacterium]|nr:hypothetical protein [Hyphomicrobiaceae bacterium]